MNLRDFRIGWRLLLKERTHSLVVILGLAAGIMVCFLLLGFVRQAFNYDASVPQVDSVYVVKTQFNYSGSAAPWKQTAPQQMHAVLARSGLPLESSGFLSLTVSAQDGARVEDLRVTMVNESFPAIFGLRAIEGDVQAALVRPDALALTAGTAMRLFGTEHAVGKSLKVAGQPYLVVAILPDPPASTTFTYSALTGVKSTVAAEGFRNIAYSQWGAMYGQVFVKLRDGVSAETVAQTLQRAADTSPLASMSPPELFSKLGSLHLIEVKLGRLRDAYLDPEVAGDDYFIQHGNANSMFALSAIAVLILMLAATNYVNLATARTLRRQREIAMRKVLGASVGRVVGQFLAESLVVTMLATVCGLVLAYVLRARFADLVNRRLDELFSPGAIAVCIGVGIVLGMLSALYPAWVAMRIKPAQALAGRNGGESASGLWIRRCLTVMQFATAMGLCCVSIAIAWQTDYATKLDPGFDPNPIIVLDMRKDFSDPQTKALLEDVERLPGVTEAAMSKDAIGRNRSSLVALFKRSGGASTSLEVKNVSANFFKTYAIKARAGRLFDKRLDNGASTGVIINETGAKALGFASAEAAVGQFLAMDHGPDGLQVIGVAPEIRFQTLRKQQEPLLYTTDDAIRTMSIRVAGDVGQAESAIEALWKQRMPGEVLHMTRARAFFELSYADDARMVRMLIAATIIAIIIAAFGIYVLAAYSVQRRTKEIVLRKLFGADRGVIGRQVAREFATLVVISALVGLPVAALAIERFLAGYLERAPFGAWPLVGAFGVALLIAMLSTLRHTLSAMRMSPLRALQA